MKKEKKIFWVVWKQRFEPRSGNSMEIFIRHPLKVVFVSMSLIFLFTSMVSSSPRISNKFIVGSPEHPAVAIPGKSTFWNNKVAHLVNQIINNIPPGGDPKIGVFEFKAMGTNKITEFSPRFKEDFIILLSQVEGLKVKEVGSISVPGAFRQMAEEKGLDYFVRGFYKQGKRGLSVWSQLISTSTGNIVSSGKVEMARNIIIAEDLALLDRLKNQESAVRALGHLQNYEESVDHLMALKPNQTSLNVKLWTEKNDYRIGEKITFFVKAEKPCYLILLDVSPDGEAKIIFPNTDSGDNFLKGNQTFQVPQESSGMEFRIQGPAGLERVKALVSLQPVNPLDLVPQGGLYAIKKNSLKGLKNLNRLVETFSNQDGSQWNEAYLEVFIHEKSQSTMRGSRKVPLIDKPQKPIDMIGTMGKELEHK